MPRRPRNQPRAKMRRRHSSADGCTSSPAVVRLQVLVQGASRILAKLHLRRRSMHELLPHLEVLAPAQRKLWAELSAVPGEFVLYGGTALALHLGHRESMDFDFFGSRPLDLSALETGIPFLAGARIVRIASVVCYPKTMNMGYLTSAS